MKRKFRLMCLLIILTFIFTQINVVSVLADNINIQPSDIQIDANCNINSNMYKVGEEFNINYSINPKEIVAKQNEISKQKEIVLVVDSSGSMDENISRNRTRLKAVKDVCNNFIDKFTKNDRVKIALVNYFDYAEVVCGLSTMNYGNKSEIQGYINNLYSGGGTNIGDGLRRAYYLLNQDNNADKYIVLLTDGEPTALTVNEYDIVSSRKRNARGEVLSQNGYLKDYFTTIRSLTYKTDNNTYYEYRGNNSFYNYIVNYGDGDYQGYALEYSKTIGNMIKNFNNNSIKTYVIGFSNGVNKDKLIQIADSCNGEYKQADDEMALSDIYDDVSYEIQSDLNYGDLTFNTVLPDGIIPVSLPDGLTFNESNHTISGNVGKLVYNLSSDSKTYIGQSINFTLKVKGTKANSYKISSNLNYEIDNTKHNINFNDININITDGFKAPMNLSQSTDKNSYALNEKFKINFNITPQNIIKSSIFTPTTKKEVVLVLDTSGSMAYDIDGNYIDNNSNKDSRMKIIEEASKRFINSLASDNSNNIKLGLINYDYLASIKSGLTSDYNSVNKLINFNAEGTTNIGDGLRKAYYMLKKGQNDAKKFIVLMTDGEPTGYSYEYEFESWWSFFRQVFITDDRNTDYYTNGTNDYIYGYKYAEKICNLIANDSDKNIQNYFVGFTTDSDKNKLEALSKECNGTYMQALKADDIDNVYNKIADNIKSDLYVQNMMFEMTIPNGFEVVDLPDGFTVKDDKVIGNLNDINYNLDGDNYVPNIKNKNFSIELKGTKKGKYDFSNIASLTYKDIDDSITTKQFEGIGEITITDSRVISIIKHGLFISKASVSSALDYINSGSSQTVSCVDGYNTEFGVLFNVKGNVDSVSVSLNDKIINVSDGNIKLYKVDGTKLNDISEISENGEYLIVYAMTPKIVDDIDKVEYKVSIDEVSDTLKVIIKPKPLLD